MTDDERTAIPEAEVTAMLRARSDGAALSHVAREHLVRAVMVGVEAPVPTPPRFSWRSVAASMAGLLLVLAAGGGLIVGIPAMDSGTSTSSAAPLATPFELRPTGLRVIDEVELNALLDRHVEGDVIARISPTEWRQDQSVALCTGRDPCQPAIGTLGRGMPDASVVSVIRAEPELADAIAGTPLDGVAALHLDGSGNVQLLGYLDQGEDVVEPFAASAPDLATAAADLPMDRSALVVSGWLSGLGPRSFDGRIRLAVSPDADPVPPSALLLPDDAYRLWTVHHAIPGPPDHGIFVLRPADPAEGVEWHIVGRLDADDDPDPGPSVSPRPAPGTP